MGSSKKGYNWWFKRGLKAITMMNFMTISDGKEKFRMAVWKISLNCSNKKNKNLIMKCWSIYGTVCVNSQRSNNKNPIRVVLENARLRA